MIRKATLQDLDVLMQITAACAQDMIDQGIFQWNENYPNRAAFETDLQHEALFVWVESKQVKGCVSVSTFMDNLYKPIKWKAPTAKNAYVHRLAVHPNDQRKGIAQKLMDFVEDWAKKQQCVSLRLDTFSQNHRNQRFYQQRGYQKLGDVFFPKQSPYPFHCYEKIL